VAAGAGGADAGSLILDYFAGKVVDFSSFRIG